MVGTRSECWGWFCAVDSIEAPFDRFEISDEILGGMVGTRSECWGWFCALSVRMDGSSCAFSVVVCTLLSWEWTEASGRSGVRGNLLYFRPTQFLIHSSRFFVFVSDFFEYFPSFCLRGIRCSAPNVCDSTWPFSSG